MAVLEGVLKRPSDPALCPSAVVIAFSFGGKLGDLFVFTTSEQHEFSVIKKVQTSLRWVGLWSKKRPYSLRQRKWMLGVGEHISQNLNNKLPRSGLEFQCFMILSKSSAGEKWAPDFLLCSWTLQVLARARMRKIRTFVFSHINYYSGRK